MSFSHLQVSTAFSLLSSTISIQALVRTAKKLHYTALAITDHNVLYGALPFYKLCLKEKIKPVIGMTADVKTDSDVIYPIVLLAKTNKGYRNLLKISSTIKTSHDENISWSSLKKFREDLIALTPGQSGEIEQLLIKGKENEAVTAAEKYIALFGKDNFYFSVQNFGTTTDTFLLNKIEQLSKKVNIPFAATNNVHYLEKDDAFAFQCLTAIRNGEKITNSEEIQNEHYFKSKEEMVELFSFLPEALENTLHIVEKCNVMIETDQELLPKYPVPKGVRADKYLKDLCFSGLKERIFHYDEKYIDRLNYELNIIGRMGFNDYFLIVWDFMKYARERGILTGPGRGSAAGSLVAYVLNITDVDPIKYGLLFERFLNPERISMPDIDIDFPDLRRDEVIEYVMNKYGKLNVAQIITFGTFGAKAAIRDTARVFGRTSQEMEQISRLIPSKLGISLQLAYKESDKFRQFVHLNKQNEHLYHTALKLEGLPRHTSTHAAGVVISEIPLSEMIPLQGGENGTYLTQFPMEDLETIGLLKMDFLGLRNLTLLERIVKNIEIRTGKKLNIKDIPQNDDKTFELLRRGDTTGIFQLESEGMRKVLRELRPTEFEDIVAVNALYRPGPMENIPKYIAGKHGLKEVQFPHPDLKPILGITYGVIVYQEQIMQIASVMAGFSLGEADLLRRAVSKKKAVLDQERKHFIHGALKRGYTEKIANEIYDLIVRFANYGFNRSHAVAYSYISWQLSYLKANYPTDFISALLTSVIGNEEKIASYVSEAKQMGIQILPPSVNVSHFPFIAEKSGIRFSLAAIKGIGASTLKGIIEARKSRPFKDFFDFCLRVPKKALNRKLIEGLVLAGAFDEFGYDRAVLLATIDVALEHAELMRPTENMSDLFAGDEMFQIKPKYIQREPMDVVEKLQLEKEVLGLYISNHPISVYAKLLKQVQVTHLVDGKPGNREVKVGVYITSVKRIRTKKGDAMAFVKISDPSGEMDGVVFPDILRRFAMVCEEGNIVLMTGYVENREGNSQFVVQRIQPMDEIEKQLQNESKTLFLKVPIENHNSNTFHHLRKIISKYTGKTAIVLHYESTKKTIKLRTKDWVEPSPQCLDDFKRLLGEENVILK